MAATGTTLIARTKSRVVIPLRLPIRVSNTLAACFVSAVGHLGNASRVPVYCPDFVNTDFSVIKQFTLPWENMGLNFRAEFFNLFNHAQFGLPVNDVRAPGFGQVNYTVNNPRLVQFGLKFTF